nr:MAG TPA: waglerin family protein [Caudoviricetes sp.]
MNVFYTVDLYIDIFRTVGSCLSAIFRVTESNRPCLAYETNVTPCHPPCVIESFLNTLVDRHTTPSLSFSDLPSL